jgi:predicted phage-related endonuclease
VPTAPRKSTPRAPKAPPAELPLDTIADTLAKLRRAKARAKKTAAEIKALEDTVKAKLGDSPAGTIGGQVAVRWATTARMNVDVKAVKEKFPEVASACSRVVTVRTFQLVDPA